MDPIALEVNKGGALVGSEESFSGDSAQESAFSQPQQQGQQVVFA
jgi:hypothetical protein